MKNINVCPFCMHDIGEDKDHVKNDLCPYCETRKSTGKTRALYHLVRLLKNDICLFERPKLLAFSMSSLEKDAFVDAFPCVLEDDIQSVSLYGQYLKKSHHISGVDARDLSHFESKSFNVIYSCLLYDYFPEHEKALREAYRVLSDKGVFLTHIAAHRLEDNDKEPYVKRKIETRQDYMSYIPNDSEVYDVHVGKLWFIEMMKKVGFGVRVYDFKDPLYNGDVTWFVGIKKES